MIGVNLLESIPPPAPSSPLVARKLRTENHRNSRDPHPPPSETPFFDPSVFVTNKE